MRPHQKTMQNRFTSLSRSTSPQEHAKNLSWGSPASLLEGSGALLGRLLGALGHLLALLGRFLGASWPLLGRSWASLGWSGSFPGWILPPLDAPDLDFGGFGGALGWILEGFGGMFWHALCCASRFITQCFNSCSSYAFAFTYAFPSFLLVRRSVQRTWNIFNLVNTVPAQDHRLLVETY